MVLHDDDFNDNVLDAAFWDEVIEGTGNFTEQNQRAECDCPADGDTSGLVTVNAHNLTRCDIQVDVNNDDTSEQLLAVCLTKTTNSSVYAENDWYRILKYNGNDKCYVQKKVAGTVTMLYNAAWTGPSGYLRIVIEGGTIYFYEEGNLRHSEAYAHGSYDCYVYITAHALTGYLGMDYFDNFLGWSISPRSFGAIVG